MPSEMLLLPAPPARTPRSAWRWLPGMKYKPESQSRAGGQSQQPAINDKVYHHLLSQFDQGHAMFQHFGVSTFGYPRTVTVYSRSAG